MLFRRFKTVFNNYRKNTSKLEYYSDILFDLVVTFTLLTIIISIVYSIINIYKLNQKHPIIASVHHAETVDERIKTGNSSTKLVLDNYRKLNRNNNNN